MHPYPHYQVTITRSTGTAAGLNADRGQKQSQAAVSSHAAKHFAMSRLRRGCVRDGEHLRIRRGPRESCRCDLLWRSRPGAQTSHVLAGREEWWNERAVQGE